MSDADPLQLLAVGPHPDDVELSCGGWLAAAAAQGHRVGIVDLTRGELATNGTVEGRAQEAAEAAACLGCAVRECLALPDGGVSAQDPEQLAALVGAIRRLQPGLLLAPHVEARHPDHQAAGELARKAWFFAGLRKYRPELGGPHRPARLIHYPQRQEVRPDFVVDVSRVYEQKRAAIAAHVSQFGAGEPTFVNQPLGLRAFEVRDRYWGASIGVDLGEPYLLGNPVPLSDPVGHFLEHPARPVLAVP